MLSYPETSIVAVALAVDAMIFSFSYSLVLKRSRWLAAFKLAASVGMFQALMPLIGFAGGIKVRPWVEAWDHWVVLAVFGTLGLSVIRNAWKGEKEGENTGGGEPLGLIALLAVGIATSIDALAVGICMAIGSMCGRNLDLTDALMAAGIIGTITFVLSLLSFGSTRLLRKLPQRGLETLAGILLIGLGVQNLISHLAGT